MPGWRFREVTLTVPQRFALRDYAAMSMTPRGMTPLKAANSSAWSVIPIKPVRLRSGSEDIGDSYRTRVLQELGEVEAVAVQLRARHGDVPAVAVLALSDKRARAVARVADVDAVWQVRDDTVVLMVDGEVPAGRDGEPGRCSLVELLGGRPRSWLERVAGWTTSSRPGWTQGGPLGAVCRECKRDLVWFDLRIAGAEQMRNSWLVGCPQHGPVSWQRTRTHPLVQARRQLDGALWTLPIAPSAHHCYVFELAGLQPGAVYVGETAHTVEHRLHQHRTGHNPAKELRKRGVSMGVPREDLLPDLPPLLTRSASRAAEQWVAAVLSHRGFIVYGGH